MVKKDIELRHKSRRLSIKEGIFASIKDAFGTNYVSPFAIAVNASNSLVAMLSSVTGILGPLSQMFGSKILGKNSRKKIVTKSVFLEALVWLPLILVAVLFSKGIITNVLPLLVLIFFSFYSIFTNFGHPAWFSWVGDIVDEKFRGRWFSKRNLYTGFVSLTLAILAAIFLDYFKKNNLTMVGFIVLFFLAFVARIVCWKIFKKQYEPKSKIKKEIYFSFGEFLIRAPKNNFGRFALFRSFFAFSISICSAVVTIYLLRTLQLNYLQYMVVVFSASVFTILVVEIWGKVADKYGNYRVLAITTILIPLIPIFWILSDSFLYLIFIPGIVRGVSWAGFNLAAGNFIYDNVSSEKRGLAVSYYNVLIGIGTFLGAGLGAILIKFLNTSFVKPIILIFLISAFVRMVVVFFGMPKVKEIKKMRRVSAKTFGHFILKQAKPTLIEETHEIASIKNYLMEK